MDNTGVGYNSSQIGEVALQMEEALSALKSAMEENWPTMVDVFRANWIGADEIAFETSFSNELKKVFSNCDIIIAGATKFICDAGKAWQEWQTNVANQLGGSQTVQQTYEHTRTTQDVNLNVASATFDPNQFAGLTSAGAENNLVSAIDAFVSTVVSAFSGMNDTIDTSKAFVGAGQAESMNNFVKGLSSNMGQIFSAVNSFKEQTIPQLVKAYSDQQATIADDAVTGASTIADAVSGIN